MLHRLLIAAGLLAATLVAGFAAVIAFDQPGTPPVLAAGNSIPGIAQWNFADLPKLQSFKARDGAPLNYRLYPGRPDQAVVLVHGSSATDTSMFKLAQTLQAAGATVYAIDLRGHGGSGFVNGDVSYLGQLDDDLADLIKSADLDRPGVRRSLIGFSSGGGYVLRIASSKRADLFNDYIALSPYIGQDSPTDRPDTGGWTKVALGRVVALSLLARAGLPWFQDLPVVHFATSAKADDRRTPVYSFRLTASLQMGRDWRSALARIAVPTTILIGSDDQLFNAAAFQPMLQAVNPRIGLTVVPGETHLGMIADPAATAAIVAAWKKLAGT
jgi:alpha-beta hydrolase superfamily lysophospholipase